MQYKEKENGKCYSIFLTGINIVKNHRNMLATLCHVKICQSVARCVEFSEVIIKNYRINTTVISIGPYHILKT